MHVGACKYDYYFYIICAKEIKYNGRAKLNNNNFFFLYYYFATLPYLSEKGVYTGEEHEGEREGREVTCKKHKRGRAHPQPCDRV